MKKKIIALGLVVALLVSCDTVKQIAISELGAMATGGGISGLGYDNASGLKQALLVGITNSVLNLNKENGYFGNTLLKILLPPEANTIVSNIGKIPGGQAMIDDVVLRLNRAAEDAAGTATPIFTSAITSMSFSDATGILFGSDQAGATNYLKKATTNQLIAAFRPKIDASLNKKLVGNISTLQSWSTLTNAYNKVANSLIGQVANMKAVNTDLGGYVTQQALNGMFTSMGQEEQKIRQDPAARVNDVLKKVFGQLDNKK